MAKIFKIPWKAWYGDDEFILEFPYDWKINFCHMDDTPELIEQNMEEAFNGPIGTPKLRNLANRKKIS